MARRPRIQFPGAVYHVMSRGNRKAPIYDDDHDRECFLEIVGEMSVRYSVRIYTLCEMSNHYHLVLDTPRGNLSDAIRHLNGCYSQAYNRRHDQTGHTFEARYRSLVIQGEIYLKRANRYVVRNPLRARVTNSAAEWRWSTYRATAGLETPPPWLYLDWIESSFNAASREDAQRRYRDYVNARTASKSKIDTKALVLGSKRFEAAVVEAIRLQQLDRLLPIGDAVPAPPPLASLFHGVAAGSHSRGEVIFDAHVTHGYCLGEIAMHLGIHRTAVGKLFARYHQRSRITSSGTP